MERFQLPRLAPLIRSARQHRTCPVRQFQARLESAAITTGPLFRSINRHGQVQLGGLAGIDVARVVKQAERTGLDAAKYAAHSLRAGHATSAAIAGASERSIMNQTRHRSVEMVRRYIRDGSLFRENSSVGGRHVMRFRPPGCSFSEWLVGFLAGTLPPGAANLRLLVASTLLLNRQRL